MPTGIPIPRLVISIGEPAGIGPDIVIDVARMSVAAELVVVGDPHLLWQRARELNVPPLTLEIFSENTAKISTPGTLKIIPVPLAAPVKAGVLDTRNAEYVLTCLTKAADLCLAYSAHALVTGPIHKGILNDAGYPFQGHTEFLQHHCHAKETLMLFVIEQLKVALATTHVPLRQVPTLITPTLLTQKLRLLHQGLQHWFQIKAPSIAVCGLNPHAGESGHLGDEEINIITPTIQQLQQEKLNIAGPFSADTIFNSEIAAPYDAILAMYHDQALPTIKTISFHTAVNVTLGLPIFRTSVDHGTALSLAGTGKAKSHSLQSAIALALSRNYKEFIPHPA